MSNPDYFEKVNWLFNQFPVFQKIGDVAFKPTLENSQKLIHFLKTPLHKLKFVHVAGTNGKGTTCSIIASVLQESGKKVGLFTSPHIRDFRERIRVNGTMIPESKVIDYVKCFQDYKFSFSPSFFEMTWAIAVDYFYREKCDIVVVETGLGGRLDATNIITPEITVITNIGLDHTTILGNTRELIAREKAGIIKHGIPIVIGESDFETEDVFLKKAISEGSPIYFCNLENYSNVFDKNTYVAFKVLDFLLEDEIDLPVFKKRGIENLYKNTELLGRNYIYSKEPLIIMDAGHNVMGIERFIRYIQDNYHEKKVRAIYGASNDKEVEKIIDLFPDNWEYYFTQFSNKRSFTIEEFKQIPKIKQLKSKFYNNPLKSFSDAQSFSNEVDMLVVFGSFYLLEEII
ncbi:MAG: bifunctional folylpolyglutamate synthase/dihydrofolate synthase [Brumimicrobium sp.]